MINPVSILLHGPLKGNAYDKIFDQISKLKKEILNEITVFVVCYVSDYERTYQIINKLNKKKVKIKIIKIKDLVNPGFFNINRQIVSVKIGLTNISENDFVIKLRNDQFIDFKKLFKVLKKYDELYLMNNAKILTTNCFTRKDRLYHPSDMFLCAKQPILLQYYSLGLNDKTHDGTILEIKQNLLLGKNFNEILCSPEIQLFKEYLISKKWNFKNSEEDSLNAIKKYFVLVNTWDINLCWNKKRTPLKPTGSLIYPQYFEASPFEGAPVEYVSCYNRHDIEGKKTLKDTLLILESKVLWKFWNGNRKFINIKWLFKHCIRMLAIIITNILPFYFGKRLEKVVYAASLKNEIKLLIKKTSIFRIYKVIKINSIKIIK
ncbi:hypothetical protein FDB39_00815 [Clostridium botulinum]|nr:hypothetical protein [Clostridium botulinum]